MNCAMCTGRAAAEQSAVFGCSPRELRYLQTKFLPGPARQQSCVSLLASPVLLLNSLGYIGFRVVSVCGNSEVLIMRKLEGGSHKSLLMNVCLVFLQL